MWARSLVAVILSMPATISVVALFLTLTAPVPSWRLPSMLMIFPIWVGVSCASFVFPRARTAAGVLLGVTAVCGAAMVIANAVGVGGHS